jgi:hypothetical protein
VDGCLVVCDLVGVADQSVEVIVVVTGASVPIMIWTDTAQYDESIFYNGPVKFFSTSTPGANLATGPARLISAALTITGANAAQLAQGSADLINLQGAPAGESFTDRITFAPNTILPSGESVEFFGTGFAFLVYAYP